MGTGGRPPPPGNGGKAGYPVDATDQRLHFSQEGTGLTLITADREPLILELFGSGAGPLARFQLTTPGGETPTRSS